MYVCVYVCVCMCVHACVRVYSLSVEPSAAPTNVRMTSTDFTSISVAWDAVPLLSLHGVLYAYIIYYTSPTQGNVTHTTSTNMTSVTTNMTSVTIPGLTPATEYRVSVAANATGGLGPRSEDQIFYTRQSRKITGSVVFRKVLYKSHGSCAVFWVFSAGLYSRQAYVQCCIRVTIPRSRSAHKRVHSALYTLHIFCLTCAAAAYI